MPCFTLAWLEQVFIWLIVVGAIVALIKLCLPWVLANLGQPGGTIIAAIKIVLWAIVAILVVYFIFDLVSCLLGAGGGGLHFPRVR